MKYRLLLLTSFACVLGLNPAQSQQITVQGQRVELLGAVGLWLEWADNAVSQYPKPKDAEFEVAYQVERNEFLRKHNARMTVLNANEGARFKLSLDGLSKVQCKEFIAFAARDPAGFSGVEVNASLVEGYATSSCRRNSSVSLMRI